MDTRNPHMHAQQKLTSDDAVAAILRRNQFYRRKMHFAFGVFVLSVAVIIILAGMLTYILENPPRPLYFVADEMGRLIQEIPIEQPNMSSDAVAGWAVEAVEATYSYDFVNYRAQLQKAQKYFTDHGWQEYMHGLEASNNLVALKDRKYLITARVVETPKLIMQGRVGPAYAWKFEMPVLVTVLFPPYDEKSQFANPLLVTAIIERRPLLQSDKGLALHQLIGDLLLSPQGQNINNPPT